VAGLAVGTLRPLGEGGERRALGAATVVLAVLVALIASEVHVTAGYGALVVLVAFVALSALLGTVLGRDSPRPVAVAVLLTTSMRDFAVAAVLAATAFGPTAAAPLGVYGIVVLLWGTGLAGYLRRRVG
jgi:hypothetical protein